MKNNKFAGFSDRLDGGTRVYFACPGNPISAMTSWPSSLLPSYWTSIRRLRQFLARATAAGTTGSGNTPTISHLFSAVCTQSSNCFHLAIGPSVSRSFVYRSVSFVHALPAQFLALVLLV